MPDGEIKLGVTLNVQNALQSAKQLQDSVKRAFDGKDIGNMDKEVQKVASGLANASDQVNLYANSLKALQTTMQSLSAQAQSGESVVGSSRQYDALIDKVRAYEQELRNAQNALAENQKNISYNANVPSAIQVPTLSESEVAQAKQVIAEYEAKLQEVRATMSAMEANGTAFPKLSAEIRQATASLDTATTTAMLLNEQFNAIESSANFAQPIEQQASSVEQSMQNVTQAVQQGTASVQEAQKTGSNAVSSTGQTGTAIVASMHSALNRLQTVVAQIESLINRADSSFSRLDSTARKTGNSVASSFASTRKHVSSTSGLMSKLGKTMEQTFSAKGLKRGLTTILKYGFGVRSLYFLFRRLRNAVKEGLQNLVKYEKAVGTSKAGKDANGIFQSTNQAITSLRTSLLYLKNAWAAAFAPIINAVMPMITTFINGIATVGNYVARLVGALTGQSRVLQAVKTSAGDYASSLDKSKKSANGAEKAQKKLNDRLAQFDDLNVLGKDDKDTGSGAGGGAGGASLDVDPKKMFKYVKVDKSEFQWILDLIDNIKKKIEESGILEAVKNLKDAFDEFLNSPFVQTLKEVFKYVTDKAFSLGLETLTNAFNLIADILRGDTNKALEDFLKLLKNLTIDPLQIAVDVVFKLAENWADNLWQEVNEGIKTKLFDKPITLEPTFNAKDQPIEALADNILTKIGERFMKAPIAISNYLFGEEATTNAINLISDKINNFFDWCISRANKFHNDFENVKGNFLLGLNAIGGVFTMLKDDFLMGCDAIGEGFNVLVDGVANGIENIVNWFNDFKEGLASGVENIKADWDSFTSDLELGWQAIIGFFNSGVETITKFFTETIPQTIDTFKSNLSQKWEDIKSNVSEKWELIKSTVINAVSTFKSNVEEKVSQFKTNLQTTWENIRSSTVEKFEALKSKIIEIWGGIKDGLKKPINGILSIVEFLVNKMIDGINGITKKLNSLPSLQFKNPFTGTDYKLGFNIPELKSVTIPRLAQGAVIPPNREFMAVLGDQSSGTNIEAPLDTIKQAVAEVMGNNGSAEMIQLLQQLITVVENKNLIIGDKEIGRANARYANQQRIIRGTSF